MSAKQTEVFNQFSATFTPATIKKWESKITAWEGNPKAPNPYEEPESGKKFFGTICLFLSLIIFIVTTLQDVRLLVAKEEAAQVGLGKLPWHKMSFIREKPLDFVGVCRHNSQDCLVDKSPL